MPVGNCTDHDVAYDYPDPPDHQASGPELLTILLASPAVVLALVLHGKSQPWFPGFFAFEGFAGVLAAFVLAAGVSALLFVGTRTYRLRHKASNRNYRISAHACHAWPKTFAVGDRVRFSRIVDNEIQEPIVTVEIGEATCHAEWHGADDRHNKDTLAKNPGPITFLTLHACDCDDDRRRYHLAPLTGHHD